MLLKISLTSKSTFLDNYDQVNIVEFFLVPKELAISQGHHCNIGIHCPGLVEIRIGRSGQMCTDCGAGQKNKLSLLLNF